MKGAIPIDKPITSHSGYTLIFSINALLQSGRAVNEIKGEILLEQVKLSSLTAGWMVGGLEGIDTFKPYAHHMQHFLCVWWRWFKQFFHDSLHGWAVFSEDFRPFKRFCCFVEWETDDNSPYSQVTGEGEMSSDFIRMLQKSYSNWIFSLYLRCLHQS